MSAFYQLLTIMKMANSDPFSSVPSLKRFLSIFLKKWNRKYTQMPYDVGEEVLWRYYPKKWGGQTSLKILTTSGEKQLTLSQVLSDFDKFTNPKFPYKDQLTASLLAKKQFHALLSKASMEDKIKLAETTRAKVNDPIIKNLLKEAIETWRSGGSYIDTLEDDEPQLEQSPMDLPRPEEDTITPGEENLTGDDVLREIENKGKSELDTVQKAEQQKTTPPIPESPVAPTSEASSPEEENLQKRFPGEDTAKTNKSFREKLIGVFRGIKSVPKKIKEELLNAPKTMVSFLTDKTFRQAQLSKAATAIRNMPVKAFKGIAKGMDSLVTAIVSSTKNEFVNMGKLYKFPAKMANKWRTKRDEIRSQEDREPSAWELVKATIPKLRKTDPVTGKKTWDDDGIDDWMLLLGTGGYVATAALTFGSSAVGGPIGQALLATGTAVGKSLATHIALNSVGDWAGSMIKETMSQNSDLLKWIASGGKKLKEYFVKKSPDTTFMGAEWVEWWGSVGAAVAKGDAGAAATDNVIFEEFRTSTFFDKTSEYLSDVFSSTGNFVEMVGSRILTSSLDDYQMSDTANQIIKGIQGALVAKLEKGMDDDEIRLAMSFDSDKYGPAPEPVSKTKTARYKTDPRRIDATRFRF